MNKLLEIKEVQNLRDINEKYNYWEGYHITTEKDDIYFLIQGEQQCCEDAGYICSEDDLDYFIGAEVLDIELTDTGLENTKLEKNYCIDDFNCGGIQFITFKTSKGVFQFAVYNSHNGYYGHNIKVIWNDELKLEDCL